MKKILLGLGTVATVVAPVVSVVACGDAKKDKFDTTTIKTAKDFKSYAAQFGYTLTDKIAEDTFTQWGGTSANPITVKAYKHTAKVGKEHNIAVIVKGARETDASATASTDAAIKDFDDRWDFSAADLEGANKVGFFHTYTDAERLANPNIGQNKYSTSYEGLKQDGSSKLILFDNTPEPIRWQ